MLGIFYYNQHPLSVILLPIDKRIQRNSSASLQTCVVTIFKSHSEMVTAPSS